jgi:hypothetical protein
LFHNIVSSIMASAEELYYESADDDDNDSASDDIDSADVDDIDSADDELLDTTWVNEFKESEQVYSEFYKEPVTAIVVYLMYVNKENELEHVHRDRCFLENPGLLKRNTIVAFIKRYQFMFSINYKLNSLLKYNIDLDPAEINDFLNAENQSCYDNRFLTAEKYLNDVVYDDSITMFQDLNALFIIFRENKPTMNQTKRISLARPTKKHNTTKRNRQKKNLKIRRE